MKLVCFNLFIYIYLSICVSIMDLSDYPSIQWHAYQRPRTGERCRRPLAEDSQKSILWFIYYVKSREFVNMSWYISYNAARLKMSAWALSFKKYSFFKKKWEPGHSFLTADELQIAGKAALFSWYLYAQRESEREGYSEKHTRTQTHTHTHTFNVYVCIYIYSLRRCSPRVASLLSRDSRISRDSRTTPLLSRTIPLLVPGAVIPVHVLPITIPALLWQSTFSQCNPL